MSMRWVDEGRRGIAIARKLGHSIVQEDPLEWPEDDEATTGYCSTLCETCGAELYVWGNSLGGEAVWYPCSSPAQSSTSGAEEGRGSGDTAD